MDLSAVVILLVFLVAASALLMRIVLLVFYKIIKGDLFIYICIYYLVSYHTSDLHVEY